ncbi:MAG: ATP-binding protein, partial [Methanobacteriota archaeon]
QVRRAIAELDVDILTMNLGMKDIILSDNKSEQQQIIQDINIAEANANQKFEILNELYLGPKSDIETAYSDFVRWKPIRDEIIRLLREGDRNEATSRVKPSGVGGTQVSRIIGDLKVVSDFAMNRGDLFFQSAEEHKNDLTLQLGILLGVILLLSFCVSYLLLRGIRRPIRELTVAAEEYRKGKFDARSRYESANEIGILSGSFNNLVDTIQVEMQSRENVARVSEVMLREEDLRSFSQELLKILLQYTSSQIGAIYLLNAEKTEYTLYESIGLCSSCQSSFSASAMEGEFGNSLATCQIQLIKEISEDTSFVLSTVSGDIRPREIITIPVCGEKEVTAMISLSSVQVYSPQTIRLVHDLSDILTARFNGVLAYAKIRDFSSTLESQNRELTSQSRELLSQTHELKEQNIELEVQKKQLDESNQLKSVFLSNMSHELRTPLNSVIALSGVLSRRLQGSIPDDEYSYLEVIERNGRLLLSLINDILDIARIEAGREEVYISSFSMQGLITSVLEMIGPQAEEKNLILNNLVDSSIPPITSDLSKCQHILQNLVANAVKFTEIGTITLSATVTDDNLQIAVTDTGIGISEEKLPYIFDEFRQVDERIGRKYGGSGLGLSIAKNYARLLDGDITVTSTPGIGSTFTLSLPLTLDIEFFVHPQERSGTSHHLISSQSRGSPGEKKTILLVEDNEPAIIQVRDLLEEQGYQVWVARDGKEALELVKLTLPDAVILDLMMPEVDGFTVLHMIRSQEKTALLPVLILTAKHITREELAFLKGNHIHQLIQKGDINRSGLLAIVKSMVSVPQEKETKVAEKYS